jgi:ATP-dependent DNA ligase
MLARLTDVLPEGPGLTYEPKWDGFRCLVFRDGDQVDLRSRNQRPLARYFPEVVEALLGVPTTRFVLDGELVVESERGIRFEELMVRLHPAASRVERLSRETPASLVAFDLLALREEDLRSLPFVERRARLEALVDPLPRRGLCVTPATDDPRLAQRWLDAPEPGIDGVVVKPADLPYQPGKRVMVKVKRRRTADCVVAGFRWLAARPLVGSLLLGLYDDAGALRHVGVASSFKTSHRAALVDQLAPYVTDLRGHPWEHGFGLGRSPIGRLLGAAGRWTPELELDWQPLRPDLVCEVVFDRWDGDRFRHPARFHRWRPDRSPGSCTFDQLCASAEVRG